jgi:hypothetical protein
MSTATPFLGAHSPHPPDFEAYSTAAIIDHRREHRAAGHHIPADLFDDLQTDAGENDVWIRSGQRLRIMTTGADAGRCASRSRFLVPIVLVALFVVVGVVGGLARPADDHLPPQCR